MTKRGKDKNGHLNKLFGEGSIIEIKALKKQEVKEILR